MGRTLVERQDQQNKTNDKTKSSDKNGNSKHRIESRNTATNLPGGSAGFMLTNTRVSTLGGSKYIAITDDKSATGKAASSTNASLLSFGFRSFQRNGMTI
jgi:hypothetical protein